MKTTISNLVYEDIEFESIKDVSTFSHIPYQNLYVKIKGKSGVNVTAVVNELNPLIKLLKKVVFRNTLYNSYHHLCVTLGISSYELYRLFVKDGKKMDRYVLFVEILLTKKEMEKSITTPYGVFSSVNDFCQKHLLDEGYMTFLLSRGLNFNSACSVVDKLKPSMLVVKGEAYPTLEKYCQAVKADYYDTMLTLYRGGKLPELKQIQVRRSLSVTYKNETFKNLSLFLNKYKNIDRDELIALLDAGITFNDAVDKCLNEAIIRKNTQYKIGDKGYATLGGVATELGISSANLSIYMSKADSLDTAIKLFVRKRSRRALGYTTVTEEEFANIFNMPVYAVNKDMTKYGSILACVHVKMNEEYKDGLVTYKKELVDLKDIVAETKISKEYLYFLCKKYGFTDFNDAVDIATHLLSESNIGEMVIFNKTFKSFSDITEYYSLNKLFIEQSRGLYHGFEELILKFRRADKFSSPFILSEGVTYLTVERLREKKGVSNNKMATLLPQAVRKNLDILAIGGSIEKARTFNRHMEDLMVLNVYNDGVYHGTVAEVLEQTKIPYNIFFSRYVKADWDLYQSVTVPVSQNKKTYKGVYKGFAYESLSQLAKHFKIPSTRLYAMVMETENVDDAMDILIAQSLGTYHRSSSTRLVGNTKKILCFNKYYVSLGDISIHFDVDLDRLKKLVSSNMSVDDAVTKLLNNRKKIEQVTFNNKTYSSIYSLEDTFNWSHTMLKDMVNAGQTHQSVLDMLLSPENKGYSVYGKHFDSLEAVADFFNYEESELETRLSDGHTLQSALEYGRIKRYDGITVEGYHFYTLDKASKALGIKKLLLVRELVRGKNPDTIVRILRTKAYKVNSLIPLDRVKGNKSDYIVYKGKKYTDIEEVVNLTGLTQEVILGKLLLAVENKTTFDAVLEEE